MTGALIVCSFSRLYISFTAAKRSASLWLMSYLWLVSVGEWWAGAMDTYVQIHAEFCAIAIGLFVLFVTTWVVDTLCCTFVRAYRCGLTSSPVPSLVVL